MISMRQNGKNTFNQLGELTGIGGGFNASNIFRNNPAIDHKDKLVNQDKTFLGLLVTR